MPTYDELFSENDIPKSLVRDLEKLQQKYSVNEDVLQKCHEWLREISELRLQVKDLEGKNNELSKRAKQIEEKRLAELESKSWKQEDELSVARRSREYSFRMLLFASVGILFLGMLTLYLLALIDKVHNLDYDRSVLLVISILAYLTFTANFAIKWINVRTIRNNLEKTEDEISKIAPALKPEETYFIDIINVNIKNLKAYYNMVKDQTEKSFFVSLGSGIFGFGLITLGIYEGINNPNSSLTVVSSAAGIITEFIAGVFFYLYNKTVLQLKDYHDSLIDVQNVLLAYKLVEAIPSTGDMSTDARNANIRIMVEGLLAKRTAISNIQEKQTGSTTPKQE